MKPSTQFGIQLSVLPILFFWVGHYPEVQKIIITMFWMTVSFYILVGINQLVEADLK